MVVRRRYEESDFVAWVWVCVIHLWSSAVGEPLEFAFDRGNSPGERGMAEEYRARIAGRPNSSFTPVGPVTCRSVESPL